jgi:uncharacterized BrkB/YihY/UPF0761 family membrane protein
VNFIISILKVSLNPLNFMTKIKEIAFFTISNLLEFLCIALYVFGIKLPANILPVYLTLVFISILITLALIIIIIAYMVIVNDEKYFSDVYQQLKDFTFTVPTKLVIFIEVCFIIMYSMLTWYYCVLLSVLNLVLSLVIRDVILKCKQKVTNV